MKILSAIATPLQRYLFYSSPSPSPSITHGHANQYRETLRSRNTKRVEQRMYLHYCKTLPKDGSPIYSSPIWEMRRNTLSFNTTPSGRRRTWVFIQPEPTIRNVLTVRHVATSGYAHDKTLRLVIFAGNLNISTKIWKKFRCFFFHQWCLTVKSEVRSSKMKTSFLFMSEGELNKMRTTLVMPVTPAGEHFVLSQFQPMQEQVKRSKIS